MLLTERDDAGKFIASDAPGLSKLAASKLIRRLLRERAPKGCVWCDSGGTAQISGPALPGLRQ